MLWVVAALADDVGGMRAPGGVTVGVPVALLFWTVVVLWVIGIVAWGFSASAGSGLAERVIAVAIAVLLGARIFGVPW